MVKCVECVQKKNLCYVSVCVCVCVSVCVCVCCVCVGLSMGLGYKAALEQVTKAA